jgi:diguanylate cyclase (GGDEF)-like protein
MDLARLRDRLSLVVPGVLVLIIGALGLLAGESAGRRAMDVHRADRLALQTTLAGLTGQSVLIGAAEVQRELADDASAGGTVRAWSATPGSRTDVARLRAIVDRTRVLDAGAVVVDALGRPLSSWSASGALPAADDPGWVPLRAAAVAQDGRLPLSGVMQAGSVPVIAMGLPVMLDDGQTGLFIGLWQARAGQLHEYVKELGYGETGHGYVVDVAGLVVAAPDDGQVGRRLRLDQVRQRLLSSTSPGIVDTDEGGVEWVSSYAPAGRTGWTSVTVQERDEFAGALERSSMLVRVAVVALLLIAGAGLVVLNRKRESALRRSALRDDLTGLYNRRGWFAVADHELERARRTGSPRVLLFVDVDGLKQVNDVLGHREGDKAIVSAARVLEGASRGSDVLGRLGGDEFVLLLGEGGDPEVARTRLVNALQAHNERSGDGFELRLSVGAEVWYPAEVCGLDELVRRADAVMYADKRSRTDRHEGIVRVPAPRPTPDHADA